ncbi:MAG: polyprenol monophosphomannose synthase [bacterium JZ-2024 1]
MTDRVLVLIPTFNEQQNISKCVREVLRCANVDVLVIDDDSPDGTAQEVHRLSETLKEASGTENRLHLIVRKKDRGFARSYAQGFRWALERGYDILITMDADMSHPPDKIPALLEALANQAEVAVGSRYIPGGRVAGWGILRRLISRIGNRMASMRTRSGIADMTSGFMAMKRACIPHLIREPIATEGYSFLMMLKVRSKRAKLRVVEVPITFTDRKHGRSKFGWAHIVEAVRVLWCNSF